MEKKASVIIKQNMGKLWLVCMLACFAIGVVLSLVLSIFMFPLGLLAIPFVMAGSIGGGVIYALIMIITLKSLEKKFAGKREEISATKTILVEGAANRDKTGGWLFVTEETVEFYAHKANFDTSSVIISRADVQDIRKQKNDLIIVAGGTEYKFVVNYCDRWLEILTSYRAEMN